MVKSLDKYLFGSSVAMYLGVPFLIYAVAVWQALVQCLRTRIPAAFAVVVSLIFLLFLSKTLLQGAISSLIIAKYFYGALLFYLIFTKRKDEFNTDNVLLYLVLIVALEATLVNTLIDPTMLGNYPLAEDGSLAHPWIFFGIYQRPYGPGGFPANTAFLIVMLYLIIDSCRGRFSAKSRIAMALAGVAVCASGSGFLLFFMALTPRLIQPTYAYRAAIPIALAVIVMWYFSSLGFDKFSHEYVAHLLEFKSTQISGVASQLTLTELFIGRGVEVSNPALGGDFALLNLLEYSGVVGFLVICAMARKVFKFSFWAGLVMCASALHYGGMFTLAGQVVTGYIMAYSNKLNRVSSEETD